MPEPSHAWRAEFPIQGGPAPHLIEGALKLEQLDSIESLRAIEPEWLRLWSEEADATLFQHPQWILSWWKQFGADKEFLGAVLRSDDEVAPSLRGVIPLCILREGGLRKIMFAGAGLSDSESSLVAGGLKQLEPQALRALLLRNEGRWDRCDFQPLPSSSALCACSDWGPLEGGIHPLETHGLLQLPPNQEVFRSGFSQHFLDRLRAARRRALQVGPIESQAVGAQDFWETLEALLKFRRNRMAKLQLTADIASDDLDRADRFFGDIALSMLQNGTLRLYRLLIAGRIAAALCGFVHNRRACFYLIGFDPIYAKASPGTLLIWEGLSSLIKEGVAECDFLRGQEQYKNRWGVMDRPYYALRMTNPLNLLQKQI